MTQEEAIKAVILARDVYVFAVTSKTDEGKDGHTEIFRISSHEAVTAMMNICDPQYVPNIEVSEDGAVVTIGRGLKAQPIKNLAHFENNNGNF